MITRKELKLYQIDHQCPKCQKGHMRPTGEAFMTNPPGYHHKCTECDHMEAFTVKYPYHITVVQD